MCYALNVDCDLTILNGSSQRSNTLYTYVSTYVVYTYSNTLWVKVFSNVAFFKSAIHATLENSSPHCVQQQQQGGQIEDLIFPNVLYRHISCDAPARFFYKLCAVCP